MGGVRKNFFVFFHDGGNLKGLKGLRSLRSLRSLKGLESHMRQLHLPLSTPHSVFCAVSYLSAYHFFYKHDIILNSDL